MPQLSSERETMPTVSGLIGKVLLAAEVVGGTDLVLIDSDGFKWVFTHDQNCCESVRIEDVCGDLSDLIGNSILNAEEVSSGDRGPLEEYDYSHTWTFYKFSTIRGSVTVRWYGTSNGYYSESVDLYRYSV